MDIDEITYEVSIQNYNLKILLECLNHINTTLQNANYINEPKKITELLKNVKSCIDNTRNNISNLETLKKHLYSNSKIEDYDTLSDTYKEIIYKTSSSLNTFLLKYIQATTFVISKSITKETKPLESNSNISDISQIEVKKSEVTIQNEEQITESPIELTQNEKKPDKKVLLISEKQNRIVLPYSTKELNKILKENNSYSNLQEIIDDKYTLPLSRFKNAAISRFKETYNLMRKKQKASIADSLDFALELTFKGSLNPAVITACENLEQLDLYLDCLELDELEKFNYFEVKYEFLPIKKYRS